MNSPTISTFFKIAAFLFTKREYIMNTKKSRSITLVSFALILIIVYVPNTVYGQLWTDHNTHDPGIVSLESLIPALDNFIGAESPSSVYEIYTRFPVTDKLSVVASLPVSHFESTGSVAGDISETSVGNPFLGVRFGNPSRGLNIEGGTRLPISSTEGDGLLTGLLVENYSLGRFLPETTTITGVVRYSQTWESGFLVRAGVGPDILLQNEGDTELTLTYFGQIIFSPGPLSLGAGFSGVTNTTAEDLSFGDRSLPDRSLPDVGILASLQIGSLRPGANFRIPLDGDVNDFLDYIVGLNLGVVLNNR